MQKNELEKQVRIFLAYEKENNPQQTFTSCRAALRLYYKMLTGDSLLKHPIITSGPGITRLLQRFREYSQDIKHLEKGTVTSEVNHVHQFLEYAFSYNPQGFVNGLKAKDIREYVIERLSVLKNSSKGRIVTSLRNFFRCQTFYGQPVHPSILRLPLSPAMWKQAAFPTTIEEKIFNSLHIIPADNTDTGKRNRCIILCFTELALRCSEVSNLELDDFNWHEGYVTVRNMKNGSERILPLSVMMGKALVEYLTQIRPETSCRTLFVRFSHLRGEPMGSSQIRGVVRRNGAKAGLEDNACGTHILRRTAASKLYTSGNSLKMVADILGHESLDSTTHYVKTDIGKLSTVASTWPGGDLHVR